MDCTRLAPTNGARPSAAWMEEISLALDFGTPVKVGRGGFLRAIRMASGPLAVVLVASFTPHDCPARTPSDAGRAPAGERL